MQTKRRALPLQLSVPPILAALAAKCLPVLRRQWLATAFVLIALCGGGQLAVDTPMGDLADEPAHAVRAAALVHGEVIGTRVMIGTTLVSGVHVDMGLYNATLFAHDLNGPMTASDRTAAFNIGWSPPRSFVPISGAVIYPPTFYLPGTAGIGLGMLLGFGPLMCLYTGRLMMLLAFTAIGATTLVVARAGRGLFFSLLVLPMTLALGASLNQDGLMIATTALAGALFTRDEETHPAAQWIAGCLLALLVCCKPPYGLLLAATVLPLRWPDLLRRLARPVLFALPMLLWMGIAVRLSMVPRDLAPYHPGPLWPGDPNIVFTQADAKANLDVLLHKPSLFFTIPYNYFSVYRAGLVMEFIGVLGWLSLYLPHLQYVLWSYAFGAALAGTFFSAGEGARRWLPADAVIVTGLITGTIIAICLSLYLVWTPVGAALLGGVQGRYLLPLAPFLPLIVPRISGAFAGRPALRHALRYAEVISILPSLALACYDIYALPALIQARFG